MVLLFFLLVVDILPYIDTPGAEQEAEWARSHPEWFTPVIYRNGFYCFELKTEADHE